MDSARGPAWVTNQGPCGHIARQAFRKKNRRKESFPAPAFAIGLQKLVRFPHTFWLSPQSPCPRKERSLPWI